MPDAIVLFPDGTFKWESEWLCEDREADSGDHEIVRCDDDRYEALAAQLQE